MKSNVKAEARQRCKATGASRLKKQELLALIISWIEATASFPSDAEYNAFWSHILSRMDASEKHADFSEPEMGKYVRKEIINSPWRCGLGCVPLGFTTFAPNAIVSCWPGI